MDGWMEHTKKTYYLQVKYFFFWGGVKSSAEITVLFKARWLGIVILMFG